MTRLPYPIEAIKFITYLTLVLTPFLAVVVIFSVILSFAETLPTGFHHKIYFFTGILALILFMLWMRHEKDIIRMHIGYLDRIFNYKT